MEPLTRLICFVITIFILEAKGNAPVIRVKRIVGGDDALRQDFPHQVCLRKKIGNKYKQFCGGSIMNEQFILTAAHCVIQKRKEDIQVVLGITDLGSIKDDDFNIIRNVIDMYPHHLYDNPGQYANDIALIKVDPIVFDNINIAPIDLPQLREPVLSGTKVWISGWGRTYGVSWILQNQIPITRQKLVFYTYEIFNYKLTAPDSPNSVTLKATKVTLIEHHLCVQKYKSFIRSVYPTQICAHETDKNDRVRKGGCNNDSGGPVTLVTYGKRTLIGIMSWVLKDPDCASPIFPDVYTKVSDFVDWIYKQMDRHKKPKKQKKNCRT